jgi:two-component system osmolarity sensor histidine kinase EnvZ
MAPIGTTISLRLIGFLLAAVVMFNLAMAFAFFAPLERDRNDGGRLPLPRQMAAIVDVIDMAPANQRPLVLAAMTSPTLSVEIVDALPVAQASKRSAPILTRFLDGYDEAFRSRDIHVDVQRQGILDRLSSDSSGWSTVRVSAKLTDGKWVTIQPQRTALLAGVLWRGLLIVGLAGIVVIVLLVVAVRQTARPIEKLAAGARSFADRLDAPDLDVGGSSELRDLAVAFNDMKTRIRGLVQERTRLLAAIAHDLRTYLTRLRMRAEFISDPIQRARAEADIQEMSALIGDTMLFARSAESRDEQIAETDVAGEVEAFVLTRQEMGDAVTYSSPPPGPLRAAVESVALRRILSNLTDNAIRYGKSAELSLQRGGDCVLIEVSDRGPGIPETELQRIVAPFARLEPSRGREAGGAGLGLAIVKALTEHYGGTLDLANLPTGGLVAKVALPAVKSTSMP